MLKKMPRGADGQCGFGFWHGYFLLEDGFVSLSMPRLNIMQ
jgi:hypothetical protein